jgi:hypothetical protein
MALNKPGIHLDFGENVSQCLKKGRCNKRRVAYGLDINWKLELRTPL